MWRNPITNRFEAGDPPANQPETTAEGFVVHDNSAPGATQRGGDIHGGWSYAAGNGQPFIPVAGGDADGKGGQVLAVTDVLGVTSLDVKDSHQQVGNFGPEAASTNDGPRGQGGTGAPRG